ncbi:MAG: hypothetical protein ACYTXA_15785, partial [Nostoc sp.]
RQREAAPTRGCANERLRQREAAPTRGCANERLRQREASLSETRTRTPTTSLRVKDLGFGNQDS